MPSSLAAQLAQGASLNAAFLIDRTRRKAIESYLFTGREAAQHDLDTIHALAVNGLLQLRSLDRRLASFEESLFSSAARDMDRTLQTAEDNAKLNTMIEEFLGFLGPFILEAPTGKILEWLVRRFRINEFNVESVLGMFLPYHESPHFAKMLTILHISEPSVHSYLLSTKTATLPLARQTLVTAMSKSPELVRFVSGLLPSAVKAQAPHRTLVAFHTAVFMDFIARSQHTSRNVIEEGVLASLISSFLGSLTQDEASSPTGVFRDAVLSSYACLCSLSSTCRLAPATLRVVIEAMLTAGRTLPSNQVLRAAIAFCGPQDMQEKWSKRAVSSLLQFPEVDQLLEASSSYSGSEKFICPFLPWMVSNFSEMDQAILEQIVTSKNTHTLVIENLSVHLLQRALSSKPEGSIRLLATLHQRRSSTLMRATSTVTSADASLQPAIDQLVLSLANAGSVGGASAQMDVVLASRHADPAIRAIAVRDIYKAMTSWGDVEAEEVTSLRGALRSRIADTAPTVLAALYAEPNQLLTVLNEDAESYIADVAAAVHPLDTSAPRALVRAHVDFLSFHFLPSLPKNEAATDSLIRTAFEKVYFPYLLLSNPRHKTARVVWASMTDSRAEHGIGSFELVLGAADTYTWGMKDAETTEASIKKGANGKESEKDPQVKTMAKINVGVAARMAELAAVSEQRDAHTDFFLSSLSSPDSHARLLAALILRSLLSSLSGSLQITTAWRIIDAIGSESIANMSKFMGGVDSLQTFLSDESLSTTAVLKPNSGTTKDKLFAALLALIPLIPRPTGVQLDWMVESSSESTASASYIRLLRKLYSLANSAAMLPLLSANLLRAVFIGLGPDALLFLAGIWSTEHTSITSGSEGERTAHAALSHAVAFFAAHRGAPSPVDFQTVIPSLLAQLQSESKIVREAAMECLVLINHIAQAAKPSSIYAMDEVYATDSSKIQFVDWPDLGRYLAALVAQRDHVTGSSSYLLDFHAEHLTKAKGEGKKESSYKQRILCYLLSHVQACPLPTLQTALLRSLSHVSSPVKVEMLFDLISDTIKKEKNALENSYAEDAEPFVKYLIGCFDSNACILLQEPGGKEWVLFCQVVTRLFRPGFFSSPKDQIVYAIGHGVYKGLDLDQKLELCKTLLILAKEGDAASNTVKDVLISVLREESVIIRLVTAVKPNATDVPPRANKRAKMEGATVATQVDDRLTSITLVSEVLSTIPLPASLELVSTLLETLSVVTQLASVAEGEAAYAQQLLMNAVEAAASPVLATQKNGAKSGAIRLDILVELIRASSNPQTFHQALLLIAHVAPLARESIIHNLMPIFTFMGSNIFHRDDVYSFRVVQKTIESIAPVMISSLKESNKEPLRLWISARQFLHVFSDAANHVPRHRRTHFFSHLVEVLGADEFLAPMCMLLVDKVANRATKQTLDDAQATMNLPLMLMQKLDVARQVTAMHAILHEAKTHLGNITGTNHVTFLGDISDEGQPSSSANGLPRRIQALVMFAGCVVRQAPPNLLAVAEVPTAAVDTLVSSLLELSANTQVLTAPEQAGVLKAVQGALHSVLSAVSAQDFLKVVLGMVNSNDVKLQEGALSLIKERVGRIADETRQKAKDTTSSIIAAIVTMLSSQQTTTLLPSALQALIAIITTAIPGEEPSLLNTVTVLVHFIQNRKCHGLALEAMRPLVGKLGPRMIPHLQNIVGQAVSIIQDEDTDLAADENALGVLASSLSAIPTFWGKNELMAVLQVYVQGSYSEELQSSLNTFMKALTRKVPAKTLLATVCDAYTELQVTGSKSAAARYIAFFQVLKRTLHAAPRNEVQAQLRPLFKLFLDAFERRQRVEEAEDDEAEEHVIQAFVELVVKLNEASFRPLYRRLFDWAFGNDENIFKKITFCKMYSSLLDYFKGLMTSYMSFLLVPFKTILGGSNMGSSEHQALWSSVIEIITKSLGDDEGAFWRDDQLKQIAAPLVAQVPVCVEMGLPDGGTQVQECLSDLVDVVSEDTLLKSINLSLLMHTRVEEVRLRIYALQCSQVLWRNHGAKLLGLVAESATFVAECAEDESDSVVEEALKLKDAIEAVAGSISNL